MIDANFSAPDPQTLFALLERLPLGVVLLDQHGRVLLYNAAEERIARRRREDVLGRAFFDEVAPCIRDAGVGAEFHARIGRETFEVQREVPFAFPFRDSPRVVDLKLVSVEAGGRPYGCLLLEDVTAKRALERLKQNLSALLVHDLKNPISAVFANLDLIDSGVASATEDARLSARRLQAMVGGLLDIARLEDGAIPLKLAPVDLRALALACVKAQAPLAAYTDVELRWTGGDAPCPALADAEIVRRALDNLLDNAIRYAPRATSIDVWAAPDAGRVALCVRDYGRGVPAELRSTIFEKYSRVEGASRGANHGLGLTFVRLAAEAHGGAARVEAPPSGEGSVFRIDLPPATAALAR